MFHNLHSHRSVRDRHIGMMVLLVSDFHNLIGESPHRVVIAEAKRLL
jgi:hypothetical protein